MRRNPNLELCLLPPSASLNSDNHHPMSRELIYGSTPNEREEKNQPLTIFYNGNVSVCDVNDFQARAIILLASQEGDEIRTTTPTPTPTPTRTPTTMTTSSAPSPSSSSPTMYSPRNGLSMKRSLQQFLQKRRNRTLAISPYTR